MSTAPHTKKEKKNRNSNSAS